MFKIPVISSFKEVIHHIKLTAKKSPVENSFKEFFFSYLDIFPCIKLINNLFTEGDKQFLSTDILVKGGYNIFYVLELFRLSTDIHSLITPSGNTKQDRLCILHGDFLYTQALITSQILDQETRYRLMQCVFKSSYCRIHSALLREKNSPWRCSRKYVFFFEFCYFFYLRNVSVLLRISDLSLSRISGLLGRVHAAAFYFLSESYLSEDSSIFTKVQWYEEVYDKVLSKSFVLIQNIYDIKFMKLVYKNTLSDFLYNKNRKYSNG